MLNPFLPARIDNHYQGHKLAMRLLLPIALMKLPLALYAILDGRYLAETADAMPLDTFSTAGATTVLAFWLFGDSSNFCLAQ